MSTKISASLVLVFGLAGAVIAQDRIEIPPEPKVKPVVTPMPAAEDKNRNRIADQLDLAVENAQKVLGNPAAPLSEKSLAKSSLGANVDIAINFTCRPSEADVRQFVAKGGSIKRFFKATAYGWIGQVPLEQLPTLPRVLGSCFNAIFSDVPLEKHMHISTRLGRVRQQWALGYSGNANITIAIIDSGISTDGGTTGGVHADLAGRQQYWHDYTADAAMHPRDRDEHGTHVAGIALGSGTTGGANPATIRYTDAQFFPGGALSTNFRRHLFEVPTPQGGTGAARFQWDASAVWGAIGGDPAREVGLRWFVYQNYDDPATTASDVGFFSLTAAATDATGTFTHSSVTDRPTGMASPFIGHSGPPVPGGANINSTLFSIGMFRTAGDDWGTTTAPTRRYSVANTLTTLNEHTFGIGDGYNLFRGVAPVCRWAGFKVFRDDGSGTLGVLRAAVDDLAAQAEGNNIKVANMSLGLQGTGIDQMLRDMTNTAVVAGVFIAISGGNDGPEGSPRDPGRAGRAMTVGASNSWNQLTLFTTHGFTTGNPEVGEDVIKPDIVAPGGSDFYGLMLSLDSNDADAGDPTFADQRANDYRAIKGTSMSSPFVAGAAALVIDAWQQAGHSWQFGSDADPLFIKMLLAATATETNLQREVNPATGGDGTNNPTLGRAATPKDPAEGYGMINVDAAIEALTRGLVPDTPITETLGDNRFDKRASSFAVELTAETWSLFTLTVPDTGDYDLYLYSYTPGALGNPLLLVSSTTAGVDEDEAIWFNPPTSGYYFLVVKRVSGSGSFTLTFPTS